MPNISPIRSFFWQQTDFALACLNRFIHPVQFNREHLIDNQIRFNQGQDFGCDRLLFRWAIASNPEIEDLYRAVWHTDL